MIRVFVDGGSGTTGLRIADRLDGRDDIERITLPSEKRHDEDCRAEAINSSDVAFLCLPDDQAVVSASLCSSERTVIIDTSTAHRTSPGWAYGFPELGEKYLEGVRTSKRIAVPGCHAGGFISLVAPLVESGVLGRGAALSCTSLTGYSGGGKKMIAQYEDGERDALLGAPRLYGLSQTHKHLKEMKAVCGLDSFPAFLPVVGDFYSGMLTTVALFSDMLAPSRGIDDIKEVYRGLYKGGVVSFVEDADEAGFMSAGALTGSDRMEISVFGNEDRILLCSRFDNLGKGASGAAVECMNIALGLPAETGLEL